MKTSITLLTMLSLLISVRLASANDLYNEARRIVIPQLKLEEASPREIFEILRKEARELDPKGTGINILYRFTPRGKEIFDRDMITMQLDNVPFTEVVHYVHMITGLHYRFDRHALIIFDNNATGSMTTRGYPVEAGVFDSRRTRRRPEKIDGWNEGENR